MFKLMNINGTYPYDSRKSPWKKVEDLYFEKVVRLLDLSEETIQYILSGGYDKRWGTWRNSLFLNKGYIIIGQDRPNLDSGQAGIMDTFGLQVELPTPVGTQAVYNHDGRYTLIERYDPEVEGEIRKAKLVYAIRKGAEVKVERVTDDWMLFSYPNGERQGKFRVPLKEMSKPGYVPVIDADLDGRDVGHFKVP